jgi:hypothetical protein
MLRTTVAALVLGAWVSLAAPPAARGQTAVLAVKSVDGLLADARYVTSMFGDGPLGTQASAVLKQIAAAKDHLGIDTRRPLGVYFTWPAGWVGRGFQPLPFVGFVPVSDEQKLRTVLGQFNFKVEKDKGGVYRVAVPGGLSLFLRFAHDHGYVALDRAALGAELPRPARFLPAFPPRRILAARLRVDRIPLIDRRFLVDRIIAPLNRAGYGESKRQPGESAAEARLRLAARKENRDFLAGPVEGAREVTLHLDLDPRRGRLKLDLTMRPRRGSPFARLLKHLGSGRSLFAGLEPGAKLRFSNYYLALEHVQRHAASHKGPGVFAFASWENIVDPYRRPFVRRAMRAATLAQQVDANDMAFAFQVRPGGWAWTAGLKLGNGRKLENLIREFIKDLPAAERDLYRLRWNRARSGDARIHQAGIPFNLSPLDDDGALYFAVREDAALASVGVGGERASSGAADPTGLTAIRQALAALNKTDGPPPVMELEGSVPWAILMGFFFAAPKGDEKVAAAWGPIVRSGRAPDAEAIRKLGNPHLSRLLAVFRGEDWDKVRARVVLTTGEEVRLRVVVDTRIFKLIPVLQAMTGGP